MGLSIGIVGMPNAGKSCLFEAMTGHDVPVSPTPYSTVEPARATAEVPDPRLEKLQALVGSAKAVHAHVEFVDTVGLASGSSAGKGMGTKFLASLRDCDALCEIVRFFEDPRVPRVEELSDPDTDAEILTIELCAADSKTCENVGERLRREVKKHPEAERKLRVVEHVHAALNEAVPVRTMRDLTPADRDDLEDLFLLTAKPLFRVANVDEGESLDDRLVAGEPALAVCASVEGDIARMAPDERAEFLEMEGLSEPAAARVIRAGRSHLGLITFFTAAEKESRAWTARKGAPAPEAAGLVHSDMQRGFIKAETVAFADLDAAGSMAEARHRGKVRQEGKHYAVAEGDVIEFKFNV